ncbi:hypothetical protein QQ045_027751 [Rhodiola kirilowii]
MGSAVIAEKWRNGTSPGDYTCSTIKIWVQVHNIPVELREGKTPRRECDRFRVELEVNKPILHGVFLAEEDREPVWIEYKYERLPNMCFKCERLNHETNQCEFESEVQPYRRKFGRWLKADYQGMVGSSSNVGRSGAAQVPEIQSYKRKQGPDS